MKKNNTLILRQTTFQSIIAGPGNERQIKTLGYIVVAFDEQLLPGTRRRICSYKTKADEVLAEAR
ncbi:MAG: hypothetical protein NTX59_00560 [Elusimicrobia bacterium]|nr:hypothetical protein [Elusimicrobiota bacterium]